MVLLGGASKHIEVVQYLTPGSCQQSDAGKHKEVVDVRLRDESDSQARQIVDKG